LLDIEVEFDIHEIEYAIIDQLEFSVADIEAIEFMIQE